MYLQPIKIWIALSLLTFTLTTPVHAEVQSTAKPTKASQNKPSPASKNASTKKTGNKETRRRRSSSKSTSSRSSSLASKNQSSIFLIHAKLHVGNGQVIDDATIEISGETIRKIGPSKSTARIPAQAKTIDLTGKIVTPGLIAAQSALGLVEIEAEASTDDSRWDSTDLIHSNFDPGSAIYADSSLLAVARVAGITSAAVSPKGGLLSGKMTWIDLSPASSTELPHRREIAISGSLVQPSNYSRAQSLELLTRVFDDARFYERNKRAFDRGQSRALSAHRLDLAALRPLLRGQIPLAIQAHRASDIAALVALADELSLKIIIVGASEAWKVADKLARSKVPVLLQPTANLPRGFDRLGSRLDQAALLDQAGVQILIADTDSPHHARNLRQEAGIAVAYGLDWEKALSAITFNVAQAFGMSRQYGTVTAGKFANIVVWSGDPLELSSAPTHVFVRGEQTTLKSRQTLLRDRYKDLSKFRP